MKVPHIPRDHVTGEDDHVWLQLLCLPNDAAVAPAHLPVVQVGDLQQGNAVPAGREMFQRERLFPHPQNMLLDAEPDAQQNQQQEKNPEYHGTPLLSGLFFKWFVSRETCGGLTCCRIQQQRQKFRRCWFLYCRLSYITDHSADSSVELSVMPSDGVSASRAGIASSVTTGCSEPS